MERTRTLVLFLILVVILSFSLYELVLRRSPVPNASAVQAGANVGVYWDAGCTQSVGSISWGTLQLGGTQEVDVYVRNEGNETFTLDLATLDWQPGNAYLWLSFSWNSGSTTVGQGQIVKVAQTLSVASDFPGGFSSFSFNIVFEGTPIVLIVEGASAVHAAASIGVYWDAGCTQSVGSISWGIMQLGGTKQVVVYVRNEGNVTFNLDLATLGWQPGNAYLWLSFWWTCQNTTIAAGQVVKVAQTLHVPSDFAGGFSLFSFNIVFTGGSYLLGDVDKDGTVGLTDLRIVASAYGSTPGSPRWNPQADVNKDGVVNLLDFIIVAEDYGKTSTG